MPAAPAELSLPPVPAVAAARPLQPVVDAPDLPAALRAFRRQHGLTVRAAGRLVGGSHSVWAQWEAGVVPGPTYLRQVADLLGLTRQQARDLAGPDRVRRPGSVGEGYSHGLAQARLRAGLSAAEFARRMHVSGSLVSRWEASGRVPARHYWPLMATVLGLDLDGVAGIYAQQVARSEVALIPSLRSLRTQRGLTQLQLANTVQADVSSIQRWERHGRAPHAQARRLAAALGTDLAALARPALAPPPPKRVALPLRRLRRQTHLSARLVAARVGVSTSALLGWERGSSRPTWAQARRLARALAVPVEDVFVAAALDPPRHLDPHHWTAAQLPAILTELRRWHGSTQAELGTLVGVTAATVSAWEHGRQRPRRSALAQLERQLCHTARLTALLSR